MISKYTLFLSVLYVLTFCSCSKNQTSKDKLYTKESSISADSIIGSDLKKYDISSKDPRIIRLPDELKEISGITMTPDGRMFAEQDEEGIVYQLDYGNGNILKKFYLGSPAIKGDFEDIAYAHEKFYMVQSNGDIYEFSEGENNKAVEYTVYKTTLSKKNDIEGMCFDPKTNTLLLITKGISGTSDTDVKAAYSFSLPDMKFNPEPRFELKKSEIKNYFNPSGIEYNGITGTFFVIAANGNMIVEISNEGKELGKEKLPPKFHAQPEGITFSKDGTLYISNEGKDQSANLVIYTFNK